MSYADQVYIDYMKQLAASPYADENPRPRYETDGGIAYTNFVTDVYVKYPQDITPLSGIRRTAWKTGIKEIRWIYQKQTSNLAELEAMGVDYWGLWAVGDGSEIGTRYGATVKRWDLMEKLLDGLVNNPFGRRHILSLYQESDFEESEGLYPCAFLTMWSVRRVGNDLYLDCSLTQRSSDFLVAGGINIIQYRALQMMIAKHCYYKVGTISHHIMNLHCYDRHQEQLAEMLTRSPQEGEPKLLLNVPDGTNFYDITEDDFEVVNYKPNKKQLKFELAI